MSREPVAERLALAGVLLGLPALFVLLVLRPDLRAMAAAREELESIRVRLEALPSAAPLGEAEKRLLDDPEAPWKRRIPALRSDAERLAHYHRVVTGLHAALRQDGLLPFTLRSSWDPIRASFSLPKSMEAAALPAPAGGTRGRMQAWVLEVRLEGPPADLFRAMRALPKAETMLEPVGLRWENTADGAQQSLLLRNYVLGP